MAAIALKLVMDDADFVYLPNNAGLWQQARGNGARFRIPGARPGAFPAPQWKHIYWFNNRVNLLLARAFLKACGHEYQEAVDTGQDDAPWVIVTDYEPAREEVTR